RAALVVDLQLCSALDWHGAQHPHLYAGLGSHCGRDELVAGTGHGPPRQHDRARSNPAQLASGDEVRHSLPGVCTCRVWNDRVEPAGLDARAGGMRLVRHTGVDWRRGAEHALCQRRAWMADAARTRSWRPLGNRVAVVPVVLWIEY